MNAIKIFGLVLIVAGVLGLAWGSFSFTKATHEAKIGPIELSVQERQRIDVPTWASGISIVAGIGLLVFGRGRG
jgi:hypothetical protein